MYNKLMKIALLLTFFLMSCSTIQDNQHASGLEIVEIQPNKLTSITKQNLLHLTQVYDLTPFLFTKSVHIQSQIIPFSQPVLTLNTKFAEYPNKILAIFLHEQFHWWIIKNQIKTNLAIVELKALFPKAPVAMSSGKDSTFTHIIVCYLQYSTLKFLMGDKEARKLIREFVEVDRLYPWIFSTILKNETKIKKIIQRQKLNPPPLV